MEKKDKKVSQIVNWLDSPCANVFPAQTTKLQQTIVCDLDNSSKWNIGGQGIMGDQMQFS